MDLTFSHDLTTNEKNLNRLSNFCWHRLLVVVDFTAAYFFLNLVIFKKSSFSYEPTATPTLIPTATATGQWLSSSTKLTCQ
jgi:hypothetical protein